MIEIEESGMFFRFEDDKVFKIEKCALYQDEISRCGAKIAEMVAIDRRNRFLVIEAKSSSPQPDGKTNEKLEEFIDAIVEKFENTLQLFHAMLLNYHGKTHLEAVPANMVNIIQCGAPAIQLVLVINGHRREWMGPVQDMLTKKTAILCRVWRSKAVAINDAKAKDLGLIA